MLSSILLCLGAWGPLAAAGGARELAGVTMAAQTRVGEAILVLNGLALHRRGTFDVYVAGLYLPETERRWQEILASDSPRKMLIHWLRSVDGEGICRMWRAGFDTEGAASEAPLEERLETVCGWMGEARTGDRFTFTYQPDRGTTVAIDGRSRGTIPDKEFADALFSTWIGPRPGPGEAFRDALMDRGGDPEARWPASQHHDEDDQAEDHPVDHEDLEALALEPAQQPTDH